MALAFQSMIQALQTFWADKGCALLYPYDMPMGAGTYHPNVVFGVLGPEPLSIALVQPSRRPGDGRYGENPNRVQRHHQFQVIIKPSPTEAQAWVKASFEAVGFDFSLHDLRFVEDNWESPTLGASGSGWEVWINNMECLQMTYFQQMGGQPCQPVCLELAYGLERMAMMLQNVESVYDLQWNEKLSYRDLFLASEQQMSRYNFEEADPEALSRRLQDVLSAGHLLTQKDCMLPAYDLFLEANHLFNLLEARGTMSVAQRAHFLQQLRLLARSCLSQPSHSSAREDTSSHNAEPIDKTMLQENNHAQYGLNHQPFGEEKVSP